MPEIYSRKYYKKIRQQDDNSQPEEIRVLSPSRGLNELGDDFMIDNKDASDLYNIKFTDNGVVEKRDGYMMVGGVLTNVPTGLGVYVNNGTQHLLCVDGGVLKKMVNYQWTNVSNGITISPTSSIHATSVDNKLFVWDGIGVTPNSNAGQTGGGCLIYDGTTTVAGKKVPKAKFSVIYKGIHFASGVPGKEARVYMSAAQEPDRFTRSASVGQGNIELNSPADVPGATEFVGDIKPNAFDLFPYDGEKVTGFGFFQDVLIITKEKSIYQVTLAEDFTPIISRITNAYGCVSHGSIATVENDMMFLSREGVCVLGNEPNYYASIRTNVLSARVGKIVERINTSAYHKVRSLFFDHKYFLAIPLDDATDNSHILVYDKRFYAWTLWGIAASGLTSYIDASNRERLAFTSSVNKALNEFTPHQYNDNGEAIRAWWRSRAFHGRKIDFHKWWKEFRPIFKGINGSIIISFYDENGEFAASDEYVINPVEGGGLGSYTYGGQMLGGGTAADYLSISSRDESNQTAGHHISDTNSSKPFYIAIKHESRVFSFQVENSRVDENFALLGFAIQFKHKDYSRRDGSMTYL